MITYTWAGDSVTDPRNSWSWTRYLTDTDLSAIGGTAISGAASPTVRDAVTPTDADVLVVMLGTNDVRFGYTPASVRKNIAAIVSTVGARHVVIAALPPSNLTAYQTTDNGQPVTINRAVDGFAMNRSVQSLAAFRGWLYVDPFSDVRRNDNTWTLGASMADGVHPTPDTASDYVGPRMTVAIRQAVEGARP